MGSEQECDDANYKSTIFYSLRWRTRHIQCV